MDEFAKHVKRDKVKLEVTSVNLEPKHIKFIKVNRINLSSLVREFIDGLMGKDKQK